MNKTLISSIAAATLVGSIGLVYAQTQSSDTYSQPQTSSAAAMDETTTPSLEPGAPAHSIANPNSSAVDSSVTSDESSSLDAQADRN